MSQDLPLNSGGVVNSHPSPLPDSGEKTGYLPSPQSEREAGGEEPLKAPLPPPHHLNSIVEAALFAADHPLTLDDLQGLFVEASEPPSRARLRATLAELQREDSNRGVELVETASGFRFQTKAHLIPWLKHLFTEKPPRYSRALLETLAIIAYRQPITRHDIESIRGISVSTDLLKKLQDYNWIRVLAHRETPGRPALYGTTRTFLDYFNLKSLDDLPTLLELRSLEDLPQGDLFGGHLLEGENLASLPENSLTN